MRHCRVALILLDNHRFEYPDQWEDWCAGEEKNGRLRAIISFDGATPQSDWVRANRVNICTEHIVESNPGWKTRTIVHKIYHLIKYALENAGATHICMLTSSSLPVVHPSAFVETMSAQKRSWIDIKCRPNNGYSAVDQFLRIGGVVCKSDPYLMLLRKDAMSVIQNEQVCDRFLTVKYAHEMFVATSLICSNSIRMNATVTYTGTSPDRFASVLKEMQGKYGTHRVRAEKEGGASLLDRTNVEDPSVYDIALELSASIDYDVRIFYGDVECRKLVYSNWEQSSLHPNSYVWNMSLVDMVSGHGCMFAHHISRVNTDEWQSWLGCTSPDGQGSADRENLIVHRVVPRYKINVFSDDIYTRYMEKIWPEKECWMYSKKKKESSFLEKRVKK